MIAIMRRKKIQPTYTLMDVAKMSGWSKWGILKKVNEGILPALVNEYDKNSEEVVQVVRQKDKHAGMQIFIPVEAADLFINAEREKLQAEQSEPRPDNLTDQDEREILASAEIVKARSETGIVVRNDVLWEWKHKEKNPNASAKIRWVLNHHKVRYPMR